MTETLSKFMKIGRFFIVGAMGLTAASCSETTKLYEFTDAEGLNCTAECEDDQNCTVECPGASACLMDDREVDAWSLVDWTTGEGRFVRFLCPPCHGDPLESCTRIVCTSTADCPASSASCIEGTCFLRNDLFPEEREGGANTVAPSPFFEQMRRRHILGFAACVVKDGEIAWCDGFGWSNILAGQRMTENTVMPVASLAKIASTLTLLSLEHDGILSLDDPALLTQNDSLSNPLRFDSPINHLHLLTHTSGVFDTDGGISAASNELSLAEHVVSLLGPGVTEPAFRVEYPGRGFEYSNLGFSALALSAEIHTGETFQNLSQEALLTPLMMENSSWSKPKMDFVSEYEWREAFYVGVETPELSDFPARGLFSTARDLAKLLAMLSSSATGGHDFFAHEMYVRMLETPFSASAPDRALGWEWLAIDEEDWVVSGGATWESAGGEPWLHHIGSAVGATSDILFRPSDGLGLVFLANARVDDLKVLHDLQKLVFDQATN